MATPTTYTEAKNEKTTALARIRQYAEMEEVKKRFTNLLGDRDGRAYVESVVIAVANSDDLQKCSPKSIMVSAMRAASLKLSVDPILHQAHLVPFGNEAQLIVDYHGLVQLSVNTGYYEIAPNVFEVYEGETVKADRFSGKVTIEGEATSKTIVGWGAYFKAKNGTERWLYMTNDECDAHGERYSRSYTSKRSAWQTDREKMRRKTVLRLLVSRWGNFSPQVQNVIMQDEPIDTEAIDMPDDSQIYVKLAPEFKHSAGASVSILTGEGNPDPIKDETWESWLALKARGEAAGLTMPNVDRSGSTESDLRSYLETVVPEIAAAEQEALQGVSE